MPSTVLKFINRTKYIFLALIAGAFLTGGLHYFEFNRLEAFFYDIRVRLKGDLKHEEHIEIVKIDQKSIQKLDEDAPLSLQTHTVLLSQIAAVKPKAISYLIDFEEIQSNTADQKKFKEDARKFVDKAKSIINQGMPIFIGTSVDARGEVLPPAPLDELPHRIALIHKDGTTFGEDEVTRQALFSIYEEPTLHLQLAGLLTNNYRPDQYKGVYFVPKVDAHYFFINYSSSTIHPTDGNLSSVFDILNESVPMSRFKGKLVIVGTQIEDSLDDYAFTPYSRSLFQNPKLFIHENIIETLVNNNAIVQLPRYSDWILTFFLTTLVTLIVFYSTPLRGVLLTVGLGLLLSLVALALFRFRGYWIHLSHPFIGTFLSYYLFVPYRLFIEYTNRWDLQRRTEVLTQVEELKSNFMSLITHDLKTPVARIQGLTEILKKLGVQTGIVNEIMSSSEELDKFITSILELAKIESNRVTLNIQSRDINKLIEDCVNKIKFQAKSKNIDIDLELEPLFPVHIDPSLITKVVINLIDNAIKYSPEKSKIKIKTAESSKQNNFIEVSIQDSGYGISKSHLENVFEKFFRPKNDLTLVTKGSGLGLYLSRYFVELHGGSLSVESQEGVGSQFTISLPE